MRAEGEYERSQGIRGKTFCKAVKVCYNHSKRAENGVNETTGRSCMENKLIRSKYFLYLTEFFAGMSVMAVELGASRLMAPYFSSSQIVWTVIIGVIMIAMAIGNVWGGKLADKSATPDKLYRRLIIAAIGIAYFMFEKKKSVPGIVSVLLIIGLCFALPGYSFAFWENDLALEDESIYNYLQVQDDTKRTTLSTNVLFGVQSVQVKGNALTGMYYDYALAAPCMAGMDGTDNEGRSVMILGMGSGTYASYCTRYFPGASVQGAEIDKKIADIATDYFGLPDSVTVAVEDGRAYLAASEEKFDVIMVDAYQDITIPFQLSSVEFFNEVRSHLKPNGVMVVNLNMTSAENGSINEYLCDTMASVFKYTVTAPVKGNTNTEVFCTNSGDWEETFLRSIANLKDSGYADMMRTVYGKLTPYEGGNCILTDDKAPVEVLGMRVLDELIGDELNYYKDELRTGGLSALLGN